MMFAYSSTFFSSGCFCSETSSVSSTSASSSRSISSGSLVSKRSCSGSGITSVGPDEELMSSYFSGVSALSFSFSSIFSGSVSEVSAAVGSFFFFFFFFFFIYVISFVFLIFFCFCLLCICCGRLLFFFVLRAVFLVTVVVFICLTLKLTLVSLRGVDYLVNFFFLGIIRVITKV